MLTAAYTRCGLTCPFIMAEIRRIVDGVDSNHRDELATMVVTLDPAYDTPQIMSDLIALHSLEEKQVIGLSGSEEEVVGVLDQFEPSGVGEALRLGVKNVAVVGDGELEAGGDGAQAVVIFLAVAARKSFFVEVTEFVERAAFDRQAKSVD